jgi:hypothetical protein
MKIKPGAAPQISTPRPEKSKPAETAKAPEASKGWQPAGAAKAGKVAAPALNAAGKQLAGLATAAAAKTIAAHADAPAGTQVTHKHPMLEGFGEALGKGLGVVVTEALALLPSWNKPVLDASGKPVQHVEGADRVGDHNILKRHQEVVGPQINALVAKMAPGAIHDLLEGLGKGATAAPGESYRLEAAVSDMLHKR